MNSQTRILPPAIFHFIANKVLDAANQPVSLDLAGLLMAELWTGLSTELKEKAPRAQHEYAERAIGEVVSMLATISPPPPRARPRVCEALTPHVTRAIASFCAEAPRSFMQIRRRIRLLVRVENQKTTAMVRAWEREGVIRNVGTTLRHQWVACPHPSLQPSDARG